MKSIIQWSSIVVFAITPTLAATDQFFDEAISGAEKRIKQYCEGDRDPLLIERSRDELEAVLASAKKSDDKYNAVEHLLRLCLIHDECPHAPNYILEGYQSTLGKYAASDLDRLVLDLKPVLIYVTMSDRDCSYGDVAESAQRKMELARKFDARGRMRRRNADPKRYDYVCFASMALSDLGAAIDFGSGATGVELKWLAEVYRARAKLLVDANLSAEALPDFGKALRAYDAALPAAHEISEQAKLGLEEARRAKRILLEAAKQQLVYDSSLELIVLRGRMATVTDATKVAMALGEFDEAFDTLEKGGRSLLHNDDLAATQEAAALVEQYNQLVELAQAALLERRVSIGPDRIALFKKRYADLSAYLQMYLGK